MIGLILLMGLVTKNAILVVDFANVQRRAGLSRREALVAAARVRLRPILMTTLAMIFGMLGLRVGIRGGVSRPHGTGRDWWIDHLHASHPGGSAGCLYLPGRSG
jgi:multidrug efflux pump subunit AcrB